ncbi:unnamed protein product [Anisakis simplex]|uniref:Piwi domain-containing protein n=1 Tax=Anisakis simplex TaxID=6269 RepID=A0A0M3KA57_ANISI|nr:unnamed protein product [Anisakis simplex]
MEINCSKMEQMLTDESAEERLVMPSKKISGMRLKAADSIAVVMNGYEIDLSNVPEKVYKHELKLMAVKQDNQLRDLTRGPRNDVSITLRRRVLWSVYTTVLKNYKDFFGSDTKMYFYDCGVTLYSINKILDREDGEKEFRLKMDQLSSNSRDFLGVKVVGIVAKLLACEEVYLRDFDESISECIDERQRSLQQFLEVAINQKLYHDQDHLLFGNKAYHRAMPHDKQLKGGKLLQSGFAKNIRVVGDSVENAVIVAQLDAKKSAFFKEQNLVALIASLCNNRFDTLLNDANTRRRVAKQLKGLVVRTNHLPKSQRIFSIFGMTKESASKVIIVIDDEEISIEEYYNHKYQIGLQYTNLPCIVERRFQAKSQVVNNYYPMECLDVCKGQRVENKKQTPDLVEELIAGCRLLPNRLKEENEKQRRAASITNQNPYFRRLGMLYPPAIIYGNNDRVEPNSNGHLEWRLNRGRALQQHLFYSPANPPRRWVVFIFEDAVSKELFDRFLYSYIERAQSHGIKLQRPSRIETIDRVDMDYLMDKMKMMRKNCVEYVMFITKDKRDPVHDKMKLTEVQASVVTQHIFSGTIQRSIGNRGAEMTLDNLIMKMNLKLGGISHAIAASTPFMRCNHLNEDICKRIWLRPTRMFIGLDMSHSSPLSFYERQAGFHASEPTVVGMAYTCGSEFGMRGLYWMQEPRVYTIQSLKEHLVEALNQFKEESANKSYPEHVIVFRGGISDGQFQKVMTLEANAFRAAFEALPSSTPPNKIRLSLICVQTNSNYRLLLDNPTSLQVDGNALQQNVPSGTCVDSSIVHPTQAEFILVAHKSIMGTARPIRCTVLVDDEPRMGLDEVEGITNCLCYMHGIVTSPISVPAHLYAASNLAKRGRNNWKIVCNNGDDDVSIASGDSGSHNQFHNDGAPDFFTNISSHLAPKLKHKFWA